MKKLIRKLCPLLFTAALVMAGSAARLQAQTVLTGTYIQNFATGGNTNDFADSGSVAGWFYWYGFYGNTGVTNDVDVNVANNPANGSLEIDLPFTASGNQQAIVGSFNDGGQYDFSETANGLNYTNITFDVLVATNTKPDSSGGFGFLNVGFYQTGTFGGVEIPGAASNGWVSLSVPVSKTAVGIGSVAAFLFNYNSYGGYPTNPITFWIDNVALNYGGPPPPPPTLSLEKPIAGLNVIDSSPGTYDRESILSTNPGYSWVGSANPVTYSFTITNFPVGSSIAAQMFLIGGITSVPSYETSPDYNESNVIIFAVEGSGTNSYGAIQYKVGEPNGNSMLYGAAPYTNAPGSGSANFGSGNLGGVNGSSALGTWSLTFANDTNITVTAPNGSSTNFAIPESDAQAFNNADGLLVLLGSQPNSTAAIGQRVVYSAMQIQGAATLLNDNFMNDTTLNTNLWTVLASAPSGVLVVPTNTAYWVDWTVPDLGYSLEIGTNVAVPASYALSSIAPAGQIGALKKTLLPAASLPAGNAGFFRLVQLKATQLQVLLPGETNAPGTTLGYVGTPTAISLAAQGLTPTPVIVNACDANWNIVSGVNDTISLTSSDSSAFLPAAMSMVNGTASFTGANGVLFQSQGSQTVTATDTTTGATLTAGTSAAVTVGP
jgi:hypothetical protein